MTRQRPTETKVLEFLGSQAKPVSASQISDGTGINNVTAHLRRLRDQGRVVRHGAAQSRVNVAWSLAEDAAAQGIEQAEQLIERAEPAKPKSRKERLADEERRVIDRLRKKGKFVVDDDDWQQTLGQAVDATVEMLIDTGELVRNEPPLFSIRVYKNGCSVSHADMAHLLASLGEA